jgi:YD repeat-containing protein
LRNTYDALNRLETTTDAETDVTGYGYDEEGNRTSVVEPEQQETTYAYDELGKLLRVVQPAIGSRRINTTRTGTACFRRTRTGTRSG